jgi:mannitol-1-phosphate 5-dehydrogenase
MEKHIFVGFGFGPIQAGLFVNEAFKSGNFSRIVISEIDQKLVDAVRANNGCYYINVAKSNGVETFKIEGIEIYNPSIAEDRKEIIKALSQSTELCTSLPSVNFFDKGENSVAQLIIAGLKSNKQKTIIYTAENNNHAAEILEQKTGSFKNVQFLNTVIGKMSQVVVDKDEIQKKNIKTIAPGIDRAFLVEEFNKILVTRCHFSDFKPGIEVFIEKADLLPFEEAKLYGHNAIHALLAYLGAQKGYKKMAELKNDKAIMQIAKDAFINESGAALIKKYAHLNDQLFTQEGFKAYAEDLLTRMTNPYLDDTIERAARDPQRKLSANDRILGTMQLALEHGIEPVNMAKGAAAGIVYLAKLENSNDPKAVLAKLIERDKYPRLFDLAEKELSK